MRAGVVSALAGDHYGTARTVEAALGLAPLTVNDANARTFNEAFAPTPHPALTTATPHLPHGASLAVAYATPVVYLSTRNWIGVYRAGAAASLSLPTAALPAGDYDVRYLYDGGSSELAPALRLRLD